MAHPVPPVNPYDPRDLQSKALQRWEEQQRVWANMEKNIRRRVPGKGRAAQLGGRNMEFAMYKKRLNIEKQFLLEGAVPPPELGGHNLWESTLRIHPGENAVRYVRMDKTEYPYPLYCKVADNRRNDADNQTNMRIVHPKERQLGVVKEQPQQPKSKDESISIIFPGKEYYSKQVARNISAIERQMPHFLVPRAYLEVCGKPPPWTFNTEEAAAAKKRAPPVAYHPPPASPSVTVSRTFSQQCGSQKKCSSLGEDDAATAVTRPDVNSCTVDVTEEAVGGPSLVISTTRILFFAEPGELSHGSVKIKNNGTTTVYYTWAPIQPVTELDDAITGNETRDEESGGDDGEISGTKNERSQTESDEGGATSARTSCDTVQVTAVPQWRSKERGEERGIRVDGEAVEQQTPRGEAKLSLRALATKSKESKTFFYLSAPLDGVILPDDEIIFPFSVRAAFAGRFTRHYELLMFPTMSRPLVVELCAFIRSPLPTLNALSDPVGEAIDAREGVNMQRQLLNTLVARESMYDASEIAKATKACIAASQAEEEAREAEITRWRLAWNDSTYMALRVPFNRDIYQRLNAMYGNIMRTMDECGRPLQHREWNGSVQTLQTKICGVRDAVCRNTLREAFNCLLRASVVCEQEREPLGLLLRRAAGVTAFSVLAHRVEQLDDSISYALGIRSRPVPLQSTVLPVIAMNQKSINNTNNQGALSGRANARQGSRARSGFTIQDNSAVLSVLTEEQGNEAEAASQEAAIEPSVQEEYRARLFTGMRRLVGDAVEQLCAILDASRNSIEAACDLPLMGITVCTRAQDVRIIQCAEDLEVDTAVEAIVPKKRK
ncbi:uncharacterized protein TEOVI_000362100 [Trypanosoma equiperdum]|uniref:MYCBP-associated protein n=1 Tax=Trypanosoma equiperdum TaxID=5694 RepID=A0A1G4IHV9_TRYEQ|nr:hypothetical protein, conserved [Trypanosoma equiperdum]